MCIAGLLKFSSFENGESGKTYFEQLKQGKVHFSKPSDFTSKELSKAQHALEGSTDFIQFDKKHPGAWAETQYFGEYIIGSPLGIKFGEKITNAYQESIPIPIGTSDYNALKMINQKLKENIEAAKNEKKCDIIAYPPNYKKIGNVFRFDSIKFEFLNVNNDATWHLASFTAIDSKPNTEFINNLLDKSGPKGSIAYNNKNEFRPWVYIPYTEFKRCLSHFNELTCGKVSYYTDNTYPYNIDDITLNPNKLLLAKDRNYKSQNEFRIIYGGPNDSFKTNYTELINFNWSKESISYGTTKESLLDTLNLL